jgi:hypothetical protein
MYRWYANASGSVDCWVCAAVEVVMRWNAVYKLLADIGMRYMLSVVGAPELLFAC